MYRSLCFQSALRSTPLCRYLSFDSGIDVFGRKVVALTVLIDGSEVVLTIVFAGVFFFTITIVST